MKTLDLKLADALAQLFQAVGPHARLSALSSIRWCCFMLEGIERHRLEAERARHEESNQIAG